MTHHEGHAHAGISAEMETCTRACLDCLEKCFGDCVRTDMPGMAQYIQLCRDCADICALDALFMSRGSAFHMQCCAVCAADCDSCADECERRAAQHQGAAAEVPRCAESCRAACLHVPEDRLTRVRRARTTDSAFSPPADAAETLHAL